jgi:hypothetical protein
MSYNVAMWVPVYLDVDREQVSREAGQSSGLALRRAEVRARRST